MIEKMEIKDNFSSYYIYEIKNDVNLLNSRAYKIIIMAFVIYIFY